METKRDVEDKYVAVRPSRPFELELSFLGDGRRTRLTCAGAGYGVEPPDGQDPVGPDGTVTLTAEALASSLFGIIQLRSSNDELAPMELCIQPSEIPVFRGLLKRLDRELAKVKRDAGKYVVTMQAVPAPDFTRREKGEGVH